MTAQTDSGIDVHDGLVTVRGDLRDACAKSLAATVMWQCRHRSARTLVLDLSAVDRIDHDGVRALVACRRAAASHDVRLVVDHPTVTVLEALRRARVASTFDIAGREVAEAAAPRLVKR